MVCFAPDDVDARSLAFLPGAHLDHRGHIELLDQVIERDGGLGPTPGFCARTSSSSRCEEAS